jgi:tripartite-type tricarboxylate transporter receptor subunit TctC
LSRDLVAALKAPDVVQQLKDRGIDAAPDSPQQFAQYIASEEKKWVPIIKKSNIKEE